MNREIKFRLYCPETKEFVKPHLFLVSGDGRCYIKSNENNTIVRADSARFKLSQFTGMKTLDNQEIYEDDFIRYENVFCDPSEGECPYSYGLVKFENGAFYCDNEDRFWPDEVLEIIGNIFENTELLENKND